jgi:hypothetical protein
LWIAAVYALWVAVAYLFFRFICPAFRHELVEAVHNLGKPHFYYAVAVAVAVGQGQVTWFGRFSLGDAWLL